MEKDKKEELCTKDIVTKEYAISFTTEERKLIRKNFFPENATDGDMVFCMNVAQNLGLNPILDEIYFVERKAKNDKNQWVTRVAPLAGKNAWIKIAHQSKDFEGMECEVNIESTPTLKDGKWVEDNDLVATAKIYKSNMKHPFTVKVSYNEYVQRKHNGEVTKFWKTQPKTMLRKVAIAQALREAFSVAGLYDEAEIKDDYEKNKPKKIESNISPEFGFGKVVGDTKEEIPDHSNEEDSVLIEGEIFGEPYITTKEDIEDMRGALGETKES